MTKIIAPNYNSRDQMMHHNLAELAPRREQIGHNPEGARKQLFHLVMKNEGCVDVATFTDIGAKQ